MSKTNQEIIDYILEKVKEQYHGKSKDLNVLATLLACVVAEKVIELKDKQHREEMIETLKSIQVPLPGEIIDEENAGKIINYIIDSIQNKLNQLEP